MKTIPFNYIIGIDQTGATRANGYPKPLTACLIDLRHTEPIIKTGLSLKNLDQVSINSICQKKAGVFIVVDCAIDLPAKLQAPPRQILRDINNYSFNKKDYGAVTAYNFFRSYLKNPSLLKNPPRRQSEILSRAHSVFSLHPYQRNIGCGSYRILKNLAQNPDWFSLWPFESPAPSKKSIVAEGYPSYFWKKFFKSKRDLNLIRSKFTKLRFTSLDEADSFVLAWGAYLTFLEEPNYLKKIKLDSITKFEGHILGVDTLSYLG